MDKRKFTVAGVATFKGKTKNRFASGKAKARARVLEICGFTNIQLHDLPRPMTKIEAVDYLKRTKKPFLAITVPDVEKKMSGKKKPAKPWIVKSGRTEPVRTPDSVMSDEKLLDLLASRIESSTPKLVV